MHHHFIIEGPMTGRSAWLIPFFLSGTRRSPQPMSHSSLSALGWLFERLSNRSRSTKPRERRSKIGSVIEAFSSRSSLFEQGHAGTSRSGQGKLFPGRDRKRCLSRDGVPWPMGNRQLFEVIRCVGTGRPGRKLCHCCRSMVVPGGAAF